MLKMTSKNKQTLLTQKLRKVKTKETRWKSKTKLIIMIMENNNKSFKII